MNINFKYCDIVSQQAIAVESAKDRVVDKKLIINEINDAFIVPFKNDVNYKHIAGEIISESGIRYPNVNASVDYETTIERLVIPKQYETGDEILYFGAVPNVWGHFLIEGFSKLWIIESEVGRKLLNTGIKIGISSYWSQMNAVPEGFKTFLKLRGINNEVIVINEITKFHKIYSPECSIFIAHKERLCTKDYLITIQHVIENGISEIKKQKLDIRTFDKIYFSRTKLTRKNAEFGEKPIEKLFKKAGYKIIYPEQHSFLEQLWLLQHAKTLVSTEGSLAHNSIFLKPETNLVLLRKAWMQYGGQFLFNKIKELNVTYIDIHCSVFVNDNPNLGPFFLYITDHLISYFEEIYRCKIKSNFSRRKFMRYTELCMKRPDFYYRHDTPPFYFELATKELLAHEDVIKTVYRRFLNVFSTNMKSKLKLIVSIFTR